MINHIGSSWPKFTLKAVCLITLLSSIALAFRFHHQGIPTLSSSSIAQTNLINIENKQAPNKADILQQQIKHTQQLDYNLTRSKISSKDTNYNKSPPPPVTLASVQSNKLLPRITSSYNPNEPKLLDYAEIIFYDPDSISGKYTVADYGLMGLVAKLQSVVYSDLYVHRYDNFQDLKLAAGPNVDQEKCIKQLTSLVDRGNHLQNNGYTSTDVNMYQYIDTFGHVSSGLLLGNTFFEGMYHECLRLDLGVGDGVPVKTRYCTANLKYNYWTQIDHYDLIGIKAGVCLPESCDSQNYKNKHELIYKLLLLHWGTFGQFIHLDGLYCLPDERSPLRSIWNNSKARLTLSGILIWLALLIYATYKFNKLNDDTKKKKKKSQQQLEKDTQVTSQRRDSSSQAWRCKSAGFGLTNGLSVSNDDSIVDNNSNDGQLDTTERKFSLKMKVYSLLSITNNLKNLLDTTKESSLMELGKESKDGESLHPRKIVDLSCIEGIKVIAMCYVIMGHVLMCITSVLANGRELASGTSMGFYMANLVPAFAVNSFFTITGILTAYLLFKQSQSLLNSPVKWLAFILYRYLRIMPMYALVVLYTKTLAKYTSSGPLWDYGTSSLGQRKMCEQEPWMYTLLFGSNFLPPLEHCIPAGWYLSNDFQFFMVTPLLVALLQKFPDRRGQRIIGLFVLAGYLTGFWSIFSRDDIDVRPIAKFAPHGFKTYIAQFSFNYTHPQYRIPAYLIGILIGYNLHCYEKDKKKYFALKKANELNDDNRQEPEWPEFIRKWSIPLSIFAVLVCCATPIIGSQLPFSKGFARFMVALITPSYHVIFATAIGLFVMLATTGHAYSALTSFLGASLWKPLARLSLCAVLINVEMINYIIQSNVNLHFLSNQYHFSLNLLCIVATYIASLVVCVLFEAPMRGILNMLLTLAFASSKAKEAAAIGITKSTSSITTTTKTKTKTTTTSTIQSVEKLPKVTETTETRRPTSV